MEKATTAGTTALVHGQRIGCAGFLWWEVSFGPLRIWVCGFWVRLRGQHTNGAVLSAAETGLQPQATVGAEPGVVWGQAGEAQAAEVEGSEAGTFAAQQVPRLTAEETFGVVELELPTEMMVLLMHVGMNRVRRSSPRGARHDQLQWLRKTREFTMRAWGCSANRSLGWSRLKGLALVGCRRRGDIFKPQMKAHGCFGFRCGMDGGVTGLLGGSRSFPPEGGRGGGRLASIQSSESTGG